MFSREESGWFGKMKKMSVGHGLQKKVGKKGNVTMVLKQKMVITLVGLYYLVLFHRVEGELTKAMEEERPANKYSIKVLKNTFGDIFDCVDINRQPAFDHPLLKNHTIQMRPTSLPEGITIENATSDSISSQVRIINEKCPVGSIPIMRIPKKLLTTASMPNVKVEDITDVYKLNSTMSDDVLYFAQIRMQRGEYYGSVGELNVYGVPQVSADQLSASAIWVINDGDGLGPREQINSILAGWMVNPSLFGDTQTRLFTYWTADGNKEKGCFNLLCPGFVQVSRDIPIGGVISPLSVYKGPQYAIRILIFKDPGTDNWWMSMGKNLDQLVGYWPKSIFCTLIGHANGMNWGGFVTTPTNKKSPPMGSGHWAQEGYGKACFFDKVRLVDKGNVYRNVRESEIYYYQNKAQCYGVGYFEQKKEGRYFPFGGPGGC